MVQTVNGEKIFLGYLTNSILINGLTTITGTDIEMSNGVIHTIDRTLTPPAIDVVDIAVALSQMETGAEFTVLVSLLTDPRFAAITQIIREAGDITIFAPTDAAFAEISATIETLSDDQITKVLTYHAFMGRAFSTAITDQLSIEMVNQENITFNLGANGVSISDMSNGEDANILEVNIQGSNGVIHVIDKVLIPAFEE
jgi:transforming growth factor-beta-induced protein